MKKSFVLSGCAFLMCLVLSVVIGSGSSDLSESTPNSAKAEAPESSLSLSLVLERLEAVETKNQELEKSHEELKEQLRSSKQKCEDDIKSLRKEVEEFKSENFVGEDVWLLTPPIRGRRGQKGEKGDSGVITTTGKPGEKGEIIHVQLPSPTEIPAPQSTTSCSVAMVILPPSLTKKQRIYPHGNETSVEVVCDFETDGGGWTIIQKRSSGPQNDFDRNWTEYSNGFGSLDGNFWLGLQNIYALTKNGDQELRIELEDFEGEKRWAKYSSFSISDASDFYRLTLSGFSGTANDSMTQSSSNSGMRFTAKDRDNDEWGGNCAVEYGGSWWYSNYCGWSNLNGPYRPKGESGNGVLWYKWKASLAKSEMKIRKKK